MRVGGGAGGGLVWEAGGQGLGVQCYGPGVIAEAWVMADGEGVVHESFWMVCRRAGEGGKTHAEDNQNGTL